MRASGALFGLWLFASVASAQQEAPPSMQLLEFLGEWGDTDPLTFEQQLDAATVAANADEKPAAQPKEESNDDE